MLSTAGQDAVYSRPGCCLQQARMLSTAGRDTVYSRPGYCIGFIVLDCLYVWYKSVKCSLLTQPASVAQLVSAFGC